MGKNKKSKKKIGKGRPAKPSGKTEETDSPLGWRERKPLTPYPNNAPLTEIPAILKRPVIQGFGPAWIHTNNTNSSATTELESEVNGQSSKASILLTQIPTGPDANFNAEDSFDIKIHSEISLLKEFFELNEESDLPRPDTSFCPTEPRPKGFYRYFSPWNARNYAHKIKSNFLSFNLACDNLASVGKVDFIADVEIMKRIMQLKNSHQYESFICHRIGNSILVDQFDLQPLYWKCKNKFWPRFEDFARASIGNENEKEVKAENSYSEIRNMEALHVFFYCCLKEVIPIEPVPDLKENENCKFQKDPIPIPGQADDKFLGRFKINIGQFVVLLGNNIPVFLKKDSKITLRTISNEGLTRSDLIDIYLEQLLLGTNQVYLAHHEDMVLKKLEWLSMNSIFKNASILKKNIIADGISMMQFLKGNVTEASHSYWLFKAPGKEHVLVDLDLGLHENKNDANPFHKCYSSLLYRICETFHKVMKTDTALSMLDHVEHLLRKDNNEIPKSVKYLKRYFQIRNGLRKSRPDISDPKNDAANYEGFDYNWKEELESH